MTFKRTIILFFKRWVAYLINELIYLIPAFIIANILFYTLFYGYRSLGLYTWERTSDLIPLAFIFIFLIILCPFYGTIKFYSGPFWEDSSLSGVLMLLSVVVAIALTELFCLNVLKNDISSHMLKLQYSSISNDGKIDIKKLTLRTFVKYLTLFFFPPLFLFPLFNKQRLFLHEMVSGVKKVDKRDV